MNQIYHIAFVVPQLEDAMEQYGKALGITFRPPVSRTYNNVDHRSEGRDIYNAPFHGRFTYSVEGPLHIELVEVSGEGVWAPGAESIHHFGMWTDDPSEKALELEDSGFHWEANRADDGSTPIVFVRRGDIRVELLNDSRRPNFVDWLNGKRDGP
jgi:hypothetical protein